MRKHVFILLFVAILFAFTNTTLAADITVGPTETLHITTTTILGPADTLRVEDGGTLIIDPPVILTNLGLINNSGNILIDGEIDNPGDIVNLGTGHIIIQPTGFIWNSIPGEVTGLIENHGFIENHGTISNLLYGVINNFGNIDNFVPINNEGTINRYFGSLINGEELILVNPVNEVPVADADGPYTGVAGTAINFDGTGSYDIGGAITSYELDFGDGSPSVLASASTQPHTYTSAGIYTVTLTVTDDNMPVGVTDVDTSTVEISVATDSDGDGIPDNIDNCPSTYNPGQEDADGDGIGDACEGSGDNGESIPEFPTIALPIAAIIGLAFIFRKKE